MTGAEPTRTKRLLRAAAAIAASTGALALTACGSSVPTELTGDISTHDPALVQEDGTWYVYSTGNGAVSDGNIQARRSSDGENWVSAGAVWETKPEWVTEAVPGVDNLWAPELYQHDDTWYLYYSASTFGSNTSSIGVATNTTLDPDDDAYEWVDHGEVLASGEGDDVNAIDPSIIESADGTPYMVYGSFWSGIYMVEIAWPDGTPVDGAEPIHIADRGTPPNAIEGANIVEHDGEYVLFVSRDSCCQGSDSTYNMAVGKSDEVTGPYVDREGVPLLNGSGTQLLASEGQNIGPGGQSVWGDVLAFHFYNGENNGDFQLALRELEWDSEGWPSTSW